MRIKKEHLKKESPWLSTRGFNNEKNDVMEGLIKPVYSIQYHNVGCQGNFRGAPYFLSQTKQDKGGNMTAKDKRDRVRISISRVTNFVVKGRAYQSSIENTSGSGVFIKTRGRFSEGQDISMTIETPGEKRTGKITRITHHGIGVEFN